MTLKQAKDILRPYGIRIQKTGYGDEYRVSYAKTDDEKSAYYTDFLDDAVATGKSMAMRWPVSNPGADELPYDEWIPAHAVRFNEDGTVSLMREDGAEPVGNGRRRNQEEHVSSLYSSLTGELLTPDQHEYRSQVPREVGEEFESSSGARYRAIAVGPLDPRGQLIVAEMIGGPLMNGRRRNMSDGFMDKAGHFHPIRWSDDYDRSELTKEDAEKKDYFGTPNAQYYKKHGLKAPRGTPRGGSSTLTKKKKRR